METGKQTISTLIKTTLKIPGTSLVMLTLDKLPKNVIQSSVNIDGQIYDAIVPYDLPNSIAIECNEDLAGRQAIFTTY